MRNTLTIVLCSAGIFAFGCSKSQSPDSVAGQKPDSVVLQGTWSGQEVGADPQGSATLIIEGSQIALYGSNPNEWYKGTFSLREETTPKQLDAVLTECSFAQYVGKTSHAIYKIEEGKLTLTGNEPGDPAVPASFDAEGALKIVFTQK